MSCLSAAKINIVPVKVQWAQKATMCVDVKADVASSLQSKYFEMTAPGGAGFYVWYNVGGAGVDPALVGKTGIVVAIAANATATTVATATASAIDANANWIAKVSAANSEAVVVKTATYEDAAIFVDGAAPTTFTFEKIFAGFNFDMGKTDGDIEASFDAAVLDITAHQSGTEVLTSLLQGVNVELSTVLKEVDSVQIARLTEKSIGGKVTVGGSELLGFGSAQIGTNMYLKSGRLILHPVTKAATDYTADWCFPAATPLMESLTFSGENPHTISAAWKIFKDELLTTAVVDKVIFGDHTKV